MLFVSIIKYKTNFQTPNRSSIGKYSATPLVTELGMNMVRLACHYRQQLSILLGICLELSVSKSVHDPTTKRLSLLVLLPKMDKIQKKLMGKSLHGELSPKNRQQAYSDCPKSFLH